VDKLGTMCGGCHTDSHHPTFEEWNGSGHAQVVEDMNPKAFINSCGRCHSGSSRLSLLKKKPLPIGQANVGIGCPTCHDPHAKHVWTDALSGVRYTNQLRQATTSTNDYSLSTSDVFAKKYNPNVNLCAQCHNHRGASWKSSSRPPHHSPQYNMLLGTVGELQPGQSHTQPAHASLSKQCVSCHMQTAPAQGETVPAKTGHSFQVTGYDLCQQCHPYPELLVQFTRMSVSDQINQLKGWLDLWAQTKAPAALFAKYGTRAWEYTTPGSLSSGGAGPDSNEQALIPDNIKKARFNLYLVLHDGSYGVHNGPYVITLLDAAQSWIETELNQ
ncbi:MAG TPA: multiheme c-type cytochrome, partial [Candidatus Sulfotelmatobacter sp.]|nr:multiheme c-type cytochrome [Candidatus Sulfotelmatobacter sp.]